MIPFWMALRLRIARAASVMSINSSRCVLAIVMVSRIIQASWIVHLAKSLLEILHFFSRISISDKPPILN
jgi:hypothetical protein